MNNALKQISLIALIIFTLSNPLLSGEPNRGGGPQWDPSKEAERLRNESQMIREKMEKASPEFKAKVGQLIEITEKLAVQLDKKSDAIKKRNPKMVEQSHKECEKLWAERMKLMDECNHAFNKMPEKDREKMKIEMKETKKESDKKDGSGLEAKNERESKSEKSKETEKADSKDWPSYE
jgi:hypothetical protein